MKDSLIILGIFVLGIILGRYEWIFPFMNNPNLSVYVLYILLFFVGISVGSDFEKLKSIRHQPISVLLLPFVTIIGTLLGVGVASLFVSQYSVYECLAVGSGFTYYSLSSVIITQAKGSELGTIALATNIIRELCVFLFTPLMIKCFGKFTPISIAGAASMDSALPFIARYCGSEFAIFSVYHGFIVDFSVPFLVTFFIYL